tara:strand:+ start:3085 stop:3753 length:669 start_codon:yes stop_codon:yes gene_type:complete
MNRILLLAKDSSEIQLIERALRVDGHVLRSEHDVAGCLSALDQWKPTLFLADLSTGMSISSLTQLSAEMKIRDVKLMVLANERDLGILEAVPQLDDFVTKPLKDIEIRLRVSRLLSTSAGKIASEVLQRGGLEIDIDRYKVTLDGVILDLTYKEYELLRFLASNPGKAFSREALLNQVWGYDYFGGARTVDVHVRRIRAKIERRQQFIETVRNVGYRFSENQ